jgi:membrane-associated phospholipid phosphatase
MISVTEEHYKKWGEQLASQKSFRQFWVFWSNYAFIIFIAATFLASQGVHFIQILVLAPIVFVVSRAVVIPLFHRWRKKERPYQRYKFEPITTWMLSWKTDLPNAFPSSHVIAYSAITGVFLIFAFPIGLGLIGATLFAGVGRVVLGYHYPIDIIVSFFVGLAIAGLCYLMVFNALYLLLP